MNILLIEDEASVISVIQRGLMEEGFSVSVAMDGHTGLHMAKAHAFDVLVLDIMMPGINGLEICRTLRSEAINTPILMLTALGSTENIVTGLDSGADDYLTKPFKLTELNARIKALARRRGPANVTREEPGFEIGGLVLNSSSMAVTRQGQPIALTATEYRLLEYFLQNQRKVLSRTQILEQVWDINFNLGTNVVDVYVNYLRKKIDKDFQPKLIHTLVGMGYMMKAD